MKIGLDSTLSDFSKNNVKKFREEENFVIDMENKKYKNEGYKLHKLVMEINSAKIDLFIGIYLEKGQEDMIIYYDGSFLGKKIADYAYELLRETSNKGLKLKDGEEFYLLNRSDVPSILIEGNIEENHREEELYNVIEKILKVEI